MSITYRSPSCGEIFPDYKDTNLFLDTTALISASRYDDFLEFLTKLVDGGCQLFTLPSAEYEFTRMAPSKQALEKCELLLQKLGIAVYPRLETRIKQPEVKEYLMVYNHCVNNGRSERKAPSFTDSLFCVLLYLYRASDVKVRLMTANYTDMPVQFFDRVDMITIEDKASAHIENIYAFNNSHYQRELASFKKNLGK